MKLPAYPAYKPTGVEWLGDVPEHWEVKRIKWSVSGCINGVWGDEPNEVDDITCVRVADFDRDNFLVIEEPPTLRAIEQSQLKTRQLVKGDLLIEKSGGGEKQLVGCVVYFDHDFKAVCSNFVARLPVVRELPPRYWCYVHAALYSGKLNYPAIKQTTGIQNLDSSAYLGTPAPFPRVNEQQTIAAFLDRETGRLDRLVTKKRELIERLKEKRTALISRTVTRGLPPAAARLADNSDLKPSGLDWLGEIPKHWEVCKLKRVTNSRCDGPFGSGLKSEHYSDEGVRVIRLQNIRFAQFDDRDAAFIDPEYYKELGDHSVLPGDLLVAGLGDENNPVGRACVAPSSIGPAMVKADCFRFRLNPNRASSAYIALQLSTTATALAGALATGTTRGRMNLTATEDREIGLPPVIEQAAITAYLDAETTKLDAMVEKVEEAVERLQEYRTALITAAVTGKIDVRKAAA